MRAPGAGEGPYPWRTPPGRAAARDTVHAYVYKSLRKADTYLYLPVRDGFERVPAALRAGLEPLALVLEVELAADRRLARGSADEVRARIDAQGFHLQLPPSVAGDPMTTAWGTDA